MLSVAPSLAETWMSLSYLHIQLSLLQVEVLCCTVKFIPILKTQQVVRYRVNETGGNRSGLGWYQTGPNSKFKFEFKKIKNSQTGHTGR